MQTFICLDFSGCLWIQNFESNGNMKRVVCCWFLQQGGLLHHIFVTFWSKIIPQEWGEESANNLSWKAQYSVKPVSRPYPETEEPNYMHISQVVPSFQTFFSKNLHALFTSPICATCLHSLSYCTSYSVIRMWNIMRSRRRPLLTCDAVWLLQDPTLRKNVLPPSSGWQESVNYEQH
jgi:hypothetical protein